MVLMKFGNKRQWSVIRFNVIGWTLSFIFLSIVRGVGTIEQGSLQFDFLSSLKMSLTLGPVLGTISGYAQILMERIYKRISIQRMLLIRSAYVILFEVALVLIAYSVYQIYFGTHIGLWAFAFDDGSFAIYFYILAVDFFMVILRQVNLMLGGNNLLKLIKGEFYTPREEKRIFMFLDLQSSTTLAEELGHIKYSMLIRDCFNDLGVVIQNDAEIYQYVGDEVILTWKLQEGLCNQNCLRAFYNFKNHLAAKNDYYQKEYSCIPFFKAGLNAGIVTVTEVGKYKKEIAYHGDTINTAARIQAKCNEFDQDLLISQQLKDQLDIEGFELQELGSITLKGKARKVLIYGVSEQSASTI